MAGKGGEMDEEGGEQNVEGALDADAAEQGVPEAGKVDASDRQRTILRWL